MGEPGSHKLLAGNLCLDFINTINGHKENNFNEYIHSYQDLITWASRCSIMFKFRLTLYLFLIPIAIISSNCMSAYSDSAAENKWDDLLLRKPFIYTVPRIDKTTAIDGVYVKKAVRKGEIVPCRRCSDWLANPGIWRIYFNKGSYRIINTDTGWKSIGTYIVSNDRLFLANDPACIYEFGLYSFKLENRQLTFHVIDDPCAIKLRGQNLSETVWFSCSPPNEEAAVTEHWPKPKGCR